MSTNGLKRYARTLWTVVEDVRNPKHDKRKRYAEGSLDVVAKGTEFVLDEWFTAGDPSGSAMDMLDKLERSTDIGRINVQDTLWRPPGSNDWPERENLSLLASVLAASEPRGPKTCREHLQAYGLSDAKQDILEALWDDPRTKRLLFEKMEGLRRTSGDVPETTSGREAPKP